MYHCHLQFYFVGRHCKVFEIIKEMLPMKNFTHTFTESEQPSSEFAAKADVIFACFEGEDIQKKMSTLTKVKRENSELILLADKEQTAVLTEFLDRVRDIWTMPFSEEEVRFRFLRWQEACKREKDAWQTSHYLEATINSVPNLIWFKDKDGIHEKVNDSFCKTVHKTKRQVEGRGHAYIWDVEHDDPACIESEREVMRRMETCIAEEIVQTKEGTMLLTTYKSPLYDLDGSVMGTVGVGIDITRERAYEEEIIQQNRTLETIFTTMDCGVMCHSLDGSRVLSINRAALSILGYDTVEEMISAGFNMIAPSVLDEDRIKLRECIETLETVGDNVSVSYRVKHKDGSVLYVMGNVKLVEENGEMFYQRFLLDCTAQKLKEQQERSEIEQRQMELIHALGTDYNLICHFDLDTGIGTPLRNPDALDGAFENAFTGELLYEECMEDYIQRLVYVDDREALTEACAPGRLVIELTNKNTYYSNYRAFIDGEIRYYQIKMVRAGSWDSRRGIVLGFRNVDGETRREMEKTALLEDALFQANRANKAKSVFLSNMSHDIRTPMNAIVGFTTLAITHIDRKDQVLEYLKKILTSGNHLVSLINDVLDMSRIESGRMHLEESLCSLPDILHGLRSIVQADIHTKQLDLYIDAVDVLDEGVRTLKKSTVINCG